MLQPFAGGHSRSLTLPPVIRETMLRTVAMTLRELFAYETDELAVLSVCAVRAADDGAWVLVHGSLLLVPEACAQMSWPAWRASQGDRHATRLDRPLPASTTIEGETWLVGRAVLDVASAERWFEELIGHQPSAASGMLALPAVHPLPGLHAQLEHPEALLQVLPDIDSPASSLISGLDRPAQALLWRAPSGPAFVLPDNVKIDGQWLYSPSRDIAGVHVTSANVDDAIATARGLLVGRAERRAWIAEAHGSGDFQYFLADVGWDPGRIDLADLEVTHVERLGRETVLSTRIRLEDVDLTAVRNVGRCSIQLPTIGRKVTHEVLLHTVEGELLDRSGPYPLLERIVSTMTVDGHVLAPIVYGITDPPPELQARLERRDQLRFELDELLRNSAQARVIADRETARERLKKMLAGARGQLLIQDRYFGQDLEDWRLLDDVKVPVRVLTGKIATDEHGVVKAAPISATVQARFRPKAPIHERLYLWDGGGLSVGGSPTTFGQAPVRIVRLREADVQQSRAEFEALWASPQFNEVPRAPEAS